MFRNCLILMMAFSTCAVLAQQDKGWYLSAEIGPAEYNPPENDLDEQSGSEDFDTSLFITKGGYQFNRYFALEGGLIVMGPWEFAGENGKVEVAAAGFRGDVVGRIPIGDWFALVGKAGVTTYGTYEETKDANGKKIDTDNAEVQPNFEFGMQFHISDHFTITAALHSILLEDPEFKRVQVGSTTSVELEKDSAFLQGVTVGLQYRF